MQLVEAVFTDMNPQIQYMMGTMLYYFHSNWKLLALIRTNSNNFILYIIKSQGF